MSCREGRPGLTEVFTVQSWELRLVLDTRPAVYKSHLELVLQAAASHKKKKALSGGIDRIGFVL